MAIVQNREWEIVTWLRAILLRPLIHRAARKLNRYSPSVRWRLFVLIYFSRRLRNNFLCTRQKKNSCRRCWRRGGNYLPRDRARAMTRGNYNQYGEGRRSVLFVYAYTYMLRRRSDIFRSVECAAALQRSSEEEGGRREDCAKEA